MDNLLMSLKSYGMIVDIYIDYLNNPEIIYFRFHKNSDANYYLRGLVNNEEFVLQVRSGLQSTYINLGNWRQLSNRDFEIILEEYKKMSDILLKY